MAPGFVGIDLDAARIDGFRRQRPDLKWVAGNLYERLEAPELARVGILNLDEYGEVGNRSAHVEAAWEYAAANKGEIDEAIRANEEGEEGFVE